VSTTTERDYVGEYTSPGGFVFGVQGWTWGDQRAESITFLINGTARICDQHGRLFKVLQRQDGTVLDLGQMTHVQIIEVLAEERINLVEEMNKHGKPCPRCKGTKLESGGSRPCQACYHKNSNTSTGLARCLTVAGWPQVPYDMLKKIVNLPPTPIEELRKIRDPQLRKDALRMRREVDAAKAEEMQQEQDE
jgi:hypothetical protein